MAQKTSITYISDLSGAEITDSDAPTVQFGWDGTDYTVDLTGKEAEKFYKAIEPYLSVATKVTGRGRATKRAASSSRSNAADVRAWARDNGYDVPERGRIPAEIRQAYDDAN